MLALIINALLFFMTSSPPISRGLALSPLHPLCATSFSVFSRRDVGPPCFPVDAFTSLVLIFLVSRLPTIILIFVSSSSSTSTSHATSNVVYTPVGALGPLSIRKSSPTNHPDGSESRRLDSVVWFSGNLCTIFSQMRSVQLFSFISIQSSPSIHHLSTDERTNRLPLPSQRRKMVFPIIHHTPTRAPLPTRTPTPLIPTPNRHRPMPMAMGKHIPRTRTRRRRIRDRGRRVRSHNPLRRKNHRRRDA